MAKLTDLDLNYRSPRKGRSLAKCGQKLSDTEIEDLITPIRAFAEKGAQE